MNRFRAWLYNRKRQRMAICVICHKLYRRARMYHCKITGTKGNKQWVWMCEPCWEDNQ